MGGRYGLVLTLKESIEQGTPLVFDHAFPDIFRKGMIYVNLKKSQFPDPFLNLENKAVEKLQLHYRIKDKKISKAYLLIRYANQETAYFKIKNVHGLVLLSYFTNLGSKEESIFYRAGTKALNWQRQPQRVIYGLTALTSTTHQQPAKFYQQLHHTICQNILELLETHPSRFINIIDAGCGNGNFLKYLEHTLNTNAPQALTRIKMTGFDFNAANILDCRHNYNGGCHFFSGNLLNIDSTLETLKTTSHIFSQEKTITILVLSGTLTRLVLSDTYQGLQALSAITRAKEIDYLIGGGLAEPMINHYLAKQHGYENLQPGSNAKKGFFCFAKSSRTKVLADKIAKMKNKNLLDLSFCQDASLLNILSRYVTPNMTVDLSYCYYTQDLEIALKMLINMQPHIKLVVQHHNTVTLRTIDQHFRHTGCITTLTYDPQQSELSLFGAYRRKVRQHSLFSRPKSPSISNTQPEHQPAATSPNPQL